MSPWAHFLYASLNKHSTIHQDSACAMLNSCWQLVCTFVDNFCHFGCVCISISVSFLNCCFCAPLLSKVSFLRSRLSLLLTFTLISVIFRLSLCWHVSLSRSFVFCKCHLHVFRLLQVLLLVFSLLHVSQFCTSPKLVLTHSLHEMILHIIRICAKHIPTT